MANELNIGLNTSHTWDLGANEADEQTVLTMDALAPTDLHSVPAGALMTATAHGWKDRVGKPGDLNYRPGTKMKFTDGDSTIYELVSASAADETFHITREHMVAHDGAACGIEGARKDGEISTIVCTADDTSDLLDTYFNIQDEAGTKYHVWFNVGSAGADPAPSGSTAVPVVFAEDAANTVVAEAVKDAVHGISGITATRSTATVTIVTTPTGDVVDVADSATATETGFTFAVTEQGSTLEELIRGGGGTALGHGTGLTSNRNIRLRNLGYI